MRWSRVLNTIDVHCAGEVGRVLLSGVLDVPGRTTAAKLRHINETDDRLRTFLTSEPRGAPFGSIVLLTPAVEPDAHSGFLVLQPDQAHAMSGSNAICATTALIETGAVPLQEPRTRIVLDTAAGLVTATADCADGRCQSVTLDMPPAFVADLDASVSTGAFGRVSYDLCFGGVFYALVDAEGLGLTIEPDSARQLTEVGTQIADEIRRSRDIVHPERPEINGLAYVMFRSPEPDGAFRTCTIMHPARVDRSPCGTGSTANLAALRARGRVAIGDTIVSRSIIGSEFRARLVGVTDVGERTDCQIRITGSAWIYALSQIGLDPADPFPDGFRLSDLWPGAKPGETDSF